MLASPPDFRAKCMVKRYFVLIVTLLIALQSVASIASEVQLHLGHTDHHDHSYQLADSDSGDSAGRSLPDNSPQHSSDHCQHNHNCFHQVLIVGLADVFGMRASNTRFVYEANYTSGPPATPFRPPII